MTIEADTMIENKDPLKLIKDPIHGNCVLSKIESRILSFALYNRLHYILQNSCAYLVYPSNKTTRFSHSIGVMHLATQMFNNSLSNADDKLITNFLIDKKAVLCSIISDMKINDGLKAEKRDGITKLKSGASNIFNDEKYYDHLYNLFGSHFLNKIAINHRSIKNNDLFCVYVILLQSMRLYALLHDIGHLPFSHLSEFTLKSTYKAICGKSTEQTYAEEEFRSKFEKLFYKNKDNDSNDIHEDIGKKLIELLLYKICQEFPITDHDYSYNVFTVHLLLNVLLEMFRKRNGRMNSIFKIVDGPFDADKIDYVVRDGYASGLIEKTGDVDRIIKLFGITKIETSKDVDNYIFCPSLQSLNDLQEIFCDRFRIYKFLLNHHKVKRYDFILQKSMEFYLQEKLERNKDYNDLITLTDFDEMPNVIISMIEKFDTIKNSKESIEKWFYQFNQINDYWVMSLLNKKMLDFLENGASTDKLITQKDLLCELFTTSQQYKSLWKRDYDYLIFQKQLGQHAIDFFSGNSFSNKKMGEIFSAYRMDKCFGESDDLEQVGYSIIKFLNKVQDDWNQDVTQSFLDENKVVLIPRTNIKTVDDDVYLMDIKKPNEEPKKFSDFSRIPSFLKNEEAHSIQFFVYCNKGDDEVELKRKISGRILDKAHQILNT